MGGSASQSTAAQWTINQRTLYVNPTGGTWNGSTSVQSFTQNYGTTKSLAVPTRTGYTFVGWANIDNQGITDTLGDSNSYYSTFSGGNSVHIYVYNNNGNGTVTHSVVADSTNPFGTGYSYKITTNGSASPGAGGFYYANGTSANATFYYLFVAKIPVGYYVQFHSNAFGGGTYYWRDVSAGTWHEGNVTNNATSGTGTQ